jgi:hypothetical protein
MYYNLCKAKNIIENTNLTIIILIIFVFAIITISCSNTESSKTVLSADTTSTVTDTNTVQGKLKEIVKMLGLATTDTSYISTNSSIKSGDIVEYCWYSERALDLYELKLDEDKSTKDTMIFVGTDTYLGNTDVDKVVYNKETITLCPDDNGVRDATTVIYHNGDTEKFTTDYIINSTDNTVIEYTVLGDGKTKTKEFTWYHYTATSIMKIHANNGYEFLWDIKYIKTKK